MQIKPETITITDLPESITKNLRRRPFEITEQDARAIFTVFEWANDEAGLYQPESIDFAHRIFQVYPHLKPDFEGVYSTVQERINANKN